MKRSQKNEPYVFVLSSKNIKDRQGFKYTTDLDLHSLKFSLVQEILPEFALQEKQDLIALKLQSQDHDPLLKLQQLQIKQSLPLLNILQSEDSSQEMLFKYFTVLRSVQYNFSQFNRKLEAELRGEDEALY